VKVKVKVKSDERAAVGLIQSRNTGAAVGPLHEPRNFHLLFQHLGMFYHEQ